MGIFKRQITFLLVWIFSWSGFALDQLMLTYEHLQPKSIYGDKVIIERNGTKFLVDKDRVKNEPKIAVEHCPDEKILGSYFEHDFDFDNSKLLITYTGQVSLLDKINRLSIRQNPINYTLERSGFDYLNYKIINFELQNNEAVIPIEISKSEFDGNYPVELIFEAYGGGYGKNMLCHKNRLISLHHNNYNAYIEPQAFFVDGIFSDVDIKYPSIEKGLSHEMEYINQFRAKNEFNRLHELLPNIHESSIALLHADLCDWECDDYEWEVKKGLNIRRVNEEIVVGLFGDVEDSDLRHFERMLDALRVVAPTLKIRYSTDVNQVTLPIHYSRCTKEFSDKFNDCYNSMWGFFMRYSDPLHGWIWIDSDLADVFRHTTLTHEIGHALGLNHNLCHDSVMSYSDQRSRYDNYFSHVDLMMLQAIYDPKLQGRKGVITTQEYVAKFDLDQKRIEEYKEDIKSTCYPNPSAYDFLIDIQIGKEY